MSIKLFDELKKIFPPERVRRSFGLIAAVFLIVSHLSCREGDSSADGEGDCPLDPLSGCTEPAPLPGDSRYGLAGQVLIHDLGCSSEDGRRDCLWIGLDSPTDFDLIVNRPPGRLGFIRGEILADPTLPHGFYLDPATTSYGDSGLFPEILTTIDRTEADPASYENGPYSPYAFSLPSELILAP